MNQQILTPQTMQALEDFLSKVEIAPFKKKLRNMLFYYLIHEHEELAPEDGDFIEDMGFLLDLLDQLERNT